MVMSIYYCTILMINIMGRQTSADSRTSVATFTGVLEEPTQCRQLKSFWLTDDFLIDSTQSSLSSAESTAKK